MLLRVLQAEVNIGYEDICGMVETFNGHGVRSLTHLAQLVEAARLDPNVAVLESMLVTGELVVLDAAHVWESEASAAPPPPTPAHARPSTRTSTHARTHLLRGAAAAPREHTGRDLCDAFDPAPVLLRRRRGLAASACRRLPALASSALATSQLALNLPRSARGCA